MASDTQAAPLLERGSSLAVLQEALDEALSGCGRLVLVGGEAGVGKTALVRAFCADLPNRAQLLEGACDALFTPRPLGPLADVAERAGEPLSGLVAAGARPHEVFSALLAELQTRRTVLVLEDLHWADDATLDVLRLLGRRLESVATLVIATYRDDELGETAPLRVVLGGLAAAPGVSRITLEPLSLAAVQRLAVPSDIDSVELHRSTAGNPFFVTEVLAAGGDTLPATVRDAVLARAAPLTVAERRVLDAVAAIPGEAEVALLEAIAPGDLPHLSGCLASGMLEGGATAVAFRHELARLAVRDATPPDRRRALARAVLLTLERAPRVDHARAAHHAVEAGDDEAVLLHAPLAGAHAAALGAHREAAAHYAAALRVAASLPTTERAALYERLAYECYLTGQIDDALVARRQALECYRHTRDTRREGDQQRWISRLSWFIGRNGDAEEAAAAAVSVLDQLPPGPELAMALSNIAHLRMLSDDIDEAVDWGERAIELAEMLGEDETVIHALNNVGSAEAIGGRGTERLERSLELALAAGAEEHVARGYTNLGGIAVRMLDLDRADRFLDDGIAYTIERDLDSWRLYMGGWRARSALYRDDWQLAAMHASAVLADPSTPPASQILPLVVLGLLRARRGDPDVWAALDRALELARRTGESQRLAPVAAARAEAAFLAGTPSRVLDEARLLDPAQLRDRWAAGELAVWITRAGADPGVVEDVPDPYRLELADRADAAAAWWRERGCTYDAALARCAADDPELLERAHDDLIRLAARPAASIFARRLREAGARPLRRGPRPTTRANPSGLTVRELDVLRLLADGLRNAQIAERLFLSPRTVDRHVSSIMRKLDAASRGAAVAEARRRKLLTQA